VPWDLYGDITILTVLLLITSWCYCINKSGDNKDFVARYIALSIPICIQLFFILLTGVIIGSILGATCFSTLPWENVEASIIVSLGILALIYILWRLPSAFKIASGTEQPNKTSPLTKFDMYP